MGDPGNTHAFITSGDGSIYDPSKWTSDNLPQRHPETNINVLIVGAGFGGMLTALECWRKGHNVVGILERGSGPNYSGDLVIIQPSAVAAIRHWPDMCAALERDKVDAGTYYVRHTGKIVYGPTDPTYNDPEHIQERKGHPFTGPVQIRKQFYQMLLEQAAKVGLKVQYGQRVESYFEDEEAGLGGVVVEGGAVRVAHVVVAADGNKSKSELLIAGEHMPPLPSGMTVYRGAFPRELTQQYGEIQKRWPTTKSSKEYWLGPGMHMGLYMSPELVAFGLTPRDDFLLEGRQAPKENWEPDVDPEDIVKVLTRVPGWDPVIEALIRSAPKGAIVHWPLLWRNLRPNWTSEGGHVVQVGDAAHTTVPASAAGATLALEDAATLATTLQLSAAGGGPKGAALGAKIYNLLRYERVSCTQKMAFVNAQLLNAATADWDAIEKDPAKVRIRFPKWIFQHDPEAYAYEKFGQAYAHSVAGMPFQNTNFPPGHKFVPWTIEEIYRDIAAGKRVEEFLDGDWS